MTDTRENIQEALLQRISRLERVIVEARRNFRERNPLESRAWLFRVEIDEDRYERTEPVEDDQREKCGRAKMSTCNQTGNDCCRNTTNG